MEHEIYEINFLDYQNEKAGKSESDGLKAPISSSMSSYFLFVVAFIAMTFALYVFCITKKHFRSLSSNKNFSDPDPKIKQVNTIDEKHEKLINHSKIDSDFV